MAKWRLRPPDAFPPDFHRGLLQAPHDRFVLGSSYTEHAIRALQREWQLFRFCVRQLGTREQLACESGFLHRASVEWDEYLKKWLLILHSRAREEEGEIAKNLDGFD